MRHIPDEHPPENISAVFICVNYNTPLLVPSFVESVLQLRLSHRARVVVVNNPSSAGNGAPLNTTDSRVACVQPNANMGYMGGAAYGLSDFLTDNALPDWVIVSNVDLELDSEDFIERLTSYPYEHTVGIVAPRVHSLLTGAEQNPYMKVRPSALRMWAYTWLYSSYTVWMGYELAAMLWKRIRGPRRDRGLFESIYAPHGSCIMFHRRYFEAGCTLSNPCFLYGEELIVAEAARRSGLQIVYDPHLSVKHVEHVSTGILMSRRLFKYAQNASRYCACAYFSRYGTPSGGCAPSV